MKIFNSRSVFMALFVFATLSACSPKVESPDPVVPDDQTGGGTGGGGDAKTLLTAHSWIPSDYSAISSDPLVIPNVGWAEFESCMKDNIWTYAATGSYVMDEGASTCEVGDPQVVNGSWELKMSNTILSIDGIEYKVKSLETGKLVLEIDIDFLGIITIKQTTTYKPL